jgi:hypothetical protein
MSFEIAATGCFMNAAQPGVRAVSEVVSFSLRGIGSSFGKKWKRKKRKRSRKEDDYMVGVVYQLCIHCRQMVSFKFPMRTWEYRALARIIDGSGSPANGGELGELRVSQGAPQRKSHKYARIQKMLENVFLTISTKVGYIKDT